MGSAEGFLPRWSRRKQLAAAREREPVDTGTPVKPPNTPPVSPEHVEDVAPPSLPSIESLDAGSDITPFLAPGVPAELTRQALRRIWMADPAIRDFIGLSENAWDFTAASGVPGFGVLSAEDAGRLVARALGAAGARMRLGQESRPSCPPAATAAPGAEAEANGDTDAPQDFGEAEISRPPPPRNHRETPPK
jgi:hypothetical protein